MAATVVTQNSVSVAPDGCTFPLPTPTEIEADYAQLVEQANQHRQHGRQIVVVQGLGFVGTAVAAVVAAARNADDQPLYFVIGVDLPSPPCYWKVASLNRGYTPVACPDEELGELIHQAAAVDGNLAATVSQQVYELADVIVVDVPLDVHNRTAQSPAEIRIGIDVFQAAIRAIGKTMRPEALVLVETTVPVGSCEFHVAPILQEERTRRGIAAPLSLAHAYERVMPGPNYVNSIRRFWRSFSGIDEPSATRAHEFLASFIETESHPLQQLADPASTELAKLLENSYRAVNIALIQEWTLLAEQTGVNLFDVVDAIRIRQGTHDNMRYPGFGVGGYCLTKDSLLAQWASTNLYQGEVTLQMTLEALQINYRMPLHTLHLLEQLCNGSLRNTNIAVLGVSYLPGVGDTRNSPTELLYDELTSRGARVAVHDPLVQTWSERPEIPVAADLADCLRDADGIIFAVPHAEYRTLAPHELLNASGGTPAIVDAQNIITDETAAALHAAGCRLFGVGKGHWRKRGYQWTKHSNDES